MRGHKINGSILLAGAAILLGVLPAPAAAEPFPENPGNDAVASLGQAIIWVAEEYRDVVSSSPYGSWNDPAPFHWTTPIMEDLSTIIGVSGFHEDGDLLTDTAGVPVGAAGTPVSDGDFAIVPTVGFTEGPPGTREVHTEVRRLYMEDPDNVFALRAGPDAFVLQISPGEVEAIASSGDPADDFPAQSFFNVFFELDIPLYGNTTLYNKASDPLVVVADDLEKLPPEVVYIHGETEAVPVYFKDGPAAGELFGYLRLAGHGVCWEVHPVPKDDLDDCRIVFRDAMDAAPLMPCAPCTPVPLLGTPGVIAVALLIIAIAILFARRQAKGRPSAA